MKSTFSCISLSIALSTMLAVADSASAQNLAGRLGNALQTVDRVLGGAAGMPQGSMTMEYFPQREQTMQGSNCQGGGGPWQPAPTYPSGPIVMPFQPAPPAQVTPQPVSPEQQKLASVRQLVAQAKQSMRNGQADSAKKFLDEAINELPEDSNLYQFRSLALFSLGQYEAAAADAYDAIKIGNLWNWDAVSDVYGSQKYTPDLRKLEQSVKQDGKQMTTRFLLAYHYLVLGHLEHGAQQLRQVLSISPQEPVATQLLAVVESRLEPTQTAGK